MKNITAALLLGIAIGISGTKYVLLGNDCPARINRVIDSSDLTIGRLERENLGLKVKLEKYEKANNAANKP